MEFNIETPALTGDTNSKKLRAYLFRLTEQLRMVLSNLDSDNFTVETAQAVRSAETAKQDVSGLKEAIIRTATMIKSIEEKLTLTLKNEYVAISDLGKYTEEAIAAYEIDGKGIEQYFNLISSVNDDISRLCGYIRTGILDDETIGLEIANFGEDGSSPFKVRLSDNKLSFFAGGDEVAYLSDSTLYITKAYITGALILGKYHIDLTKGLAFRWGE